MKQAIKALTLLAPAWIVLAWRAAICKAANKPVASSRLANVAVALAPYAVYTILSQRIESDRRTRKYFLPYGFMKKRMALVYGEDVDPSGENEKHCRFVQTFRKFLPYGLVLWWDGARRETDAAAEPPYVFDPAALEIPRRSACENPVVTFIVPVFNVARFLVECLESLRTQSLEKIEIICVDDGSTDDSGKILRHYAERDGRFVVVSQENSGASAVRNRALSQAKGRYVSFIDGDDWIEAKFAEEVSAKMRGLDLDMCLFDFECFHYKTRAPLSHSWQLSKHVADFPQGDVFSLRDLKRLEIYSSACTVMWKKAFLDASGILFQPLKLGEDLFFVIQHLLLAKRIYALNRIYYHYRRQDPKSAVSRLGGQNILAQLAAFKAMGEWCSDVLAKKDAHVRHLVKERLLQDVLYYGDRSPGFLAWLQREGFRLFDFASGGERYGKDLARRLSALLDRPHIPERIAPASTLGGLPNRDKKVFRAIEEKRKASASDLYIVVGQLNSVTNEPLDSWTFFQWLQAHGIPSRYVMWRRHKWYGKIAAETGLKDVIALSGDGMDNTEFVSACADVLPRARAVVMENTALHDTVLRWLYQLPGCSLVFLQHGVTFWKFTERAGRTFSVSNVVNVASEREKAFLEARIPPREPTYTFPEYVVAGLPRCDLLKDEREPWRKTRIVFVMFTWRYVFNNGEAAFLGSRYLAGVKRLLSKENVARLARKNVKLVLAPHHHLVTQVSGHCFDVDVEIAQTDSISYWIRHADCCVTDYSSVSFDFVFLHKPTIYWLLDRDDPLLEENDREELRFACNQSRRFYNSVDTAGQVVDMIEYYADRDFALEPEKCAIGDTFFAYRTGICERLHGEIEKFEASRKTRFST